MPTLKMSGARRPGKGGLLSRPSGADRGAVATVFAVLLAGGVLLGMLGLTVDVGLLYAEREELQSGADAAVMAIAGKCAKAQTAGIPQDCAASDLETIAQDLADQNARDGRSNVAEICSNNPPVNIGVAPCSDPSANLTACIPGTYTGTHKYLEVRTSTETRSDQFVLPPVFAQTLLGNGDYPGTSVGACARAAMGAPKPSLAVTFALCEWEDATGGGFPPDNATGAQLAAYEVVLRTHDAIPNPIPNCQPNPANQDAPGGFGWLDDTGSSPCTTQFVNDTAGAETGGISPACLDMLDKAVANRTPLFIPIFESVTGTGTKAVYTMKGVSAFVPTGYYFGASPTRKLASVLTGTQYCATQEQCIYGYFTNAIQAGGDLSDDLESLGATIVTLVG